jgi:hypothetical protein
MAQAPPREGALRRLARRVRAAVAGAEEELLERLDPGREMAGDVVQETEGCVKAEALAEPEAPEARIAAAEREEGYRSDEDEEGPALKGVHRAQPRAQEHK